jgi:hypothetical protein
LVGSSRNAPSTMMMPFLVTQIQVGTFP